MCLCDFSSLLTKHLPRMKLCFCLPRCLNSCCPGILCLSDSHSVCLLFMSVSPCWVGGNLSLSLSLSHSPTSAGFWSKHHSYSPQWDDSPTPRHTPPTFTHCPLPPFSLLLPPHPKPPVVWPHSVCLCTDIPFKLRPVTLRLMLFYILKSKILTTLVTVVSHLFMYHQCDAKLNIFACVCWTPL